MNEPALSANLARLKEDIKSLGKEKESLILSKKSEIAALESRLSELSAAVLGMEKNAGGLDRRIFEANLRIATLKSEVEALNSESLSGRKYLDYLHALEFERTAALASLEARIQTLKQDEATFSVYAARLRDASAQLMEVTGNVIALRAEAEAIGLRKKEFEEQCARERALIAEERRKSESFLGEVKAIEASVNERSLNVGRQEEMQSGRSLLRTVKRLNGKL